MFLLVPHIEDVKTTWLLPHWCGGGGGDDHGWKGLRNWRGGGGGGDGRVCRYLKLSMSVSETMSKLPKHQQQLVGNPGRTDIQSLRLALYVPAKMFI